LAPDAKMFDCSCRSGGRSSRRAGRLVASVWLLAAVGACSGESATPTGPSPSEPPPDNLQIAVNVDGSTVRDAIAGSA
jgi:hypothetical protein